MKYIKRFDDTKKINEEFGGLELVALTFGAMVELAEEGMCENPHVLYYSKFLYKILFINSSASSLPIKEVRAIDVFGFCFNELM